MITNLNLYKHEINVLYICVAVDKHYAQQFLKTTTNRINCDLIEHKVHVVCLNLILYIDKENQFEDQLELIYTEITELGIKRRDAKIVNTSIGLCRPKTLSEG